MLIWRLSHNYQRFYREEEEESDPESYIGCFHVVKHDDGRESSRAAFEYSDLLEGWRDMDLTRRAILEGNPELDRNWQQNDNEGLQKWIDESYALVEAMNREDVKAVKSKKPPKYSVEVFPSGKRFGWFANGAKYFETSGFLYSYTVHSGRYPEKRNGVDLAGAMESTGWRLPDERFRSEWVNRKPLSPDELLKIAINHVAAEESALEEKRNDQLAKQNERVLYSLRLLEGFAEANSGNPKMDEAVKLLAKLKRLLT